MIPFLDLRTQYRSIKQEIDEAVLRVLDSSAFILGPEVTAFEEDFAAYCGARYCAGVNSGTSALHLALLALGVGPGDEVVTVSMTFVATVSAIDYTGATARLVEADPETFCIDPAKIEAAITPKTKAIVPVHLHGRVADMDPILEVARRHNLPIVEDAAQAHGAEYKGKRAGSFGDIACFSFYPGKNLGAYGEGGAVVTSDEELIKKVRMLRDWGQEKRYHHVVRGYNYRMDGIQGAILRVKLRHLEAWTEGRIAAANAYRAHLDPAVVTLPAPVAAGDRHVYHVFAVQLKDRDAVQKAMNEAQIQSGIHYPVPVHLQPAFAHLGYKKGDFPVSERLADSFLSMPIFPEMTEAQAIQVAETVNKAARQSA